MTKHEDLIRDYLEGELSIKQLAKAHGLSVAGVYLILKSNHVTLRNTKLTQELIDQTHLLKAQGLTNTAIGNTLFLTRQQVSRILRKYTPSADANEVTVTYVPTEGN
jgi:hypothetical protein